MERESTGTKYMAANCEGSQSPPRAVQLKKKKKTFKFQNQNYVRSVKNIFDIQALNLHSQQGKSGSNCDLLRSHVTGSNDATLKEVG
jgi:hypothetical protein